MMKTMLTVNSKIDGLPLDVLIYECENAKGIVQICHGMSEYKERYVPFMKFLYDNGYVSIIHDHRGHGKSVKSEEDLGYMGDGGYEAMIDDVRTINEFAKEHYPNLPVILFGHSMGSMVVRAYAKQYDFTINGLIVCGSPSENKLAGVAKTMSKTMMITKGGHYRSDFLNNLAFGSYNKNIKKPNSKNSWLATDMNVVKKYDNDDLCGFVFTTNGFYNLFSLMQYCYDKKGWAMENSDLPIHFIAGSSDPCIVSQKAFSDAVNVMRDVGYKTVTGKLFPKMRHEILNEIGKERVYSDIVNNINKWCRQYSR